MIATPGAPRSLRRFDAFAAEAAGAGWTASLGRA